MKSNNSLFKILEESSLDQYYADLKFYPVLCQEQLRKLFQQRDCYQKEGLSEKVKDINDSIIKHNLRLVIHYILSYKNLGLDIEDLIQEGNIALITAVKTFDISRNCSFSHYAKICIQTHMRKAIAKKARIVTLPEKVNEMVFKYRYAYAAYICEFNKEPTIQDMAIYANIEEVKIKEIMSYLQRIRSLDEEVDAKNYENFCYKEIIPSSTPSPEEVCFQNEVIFDMEELFEKCGLTNNEKQVIIYSYGLFENYNLTGVEIASKLNLSTQRISQLKHSALLKIKNKLKNYKSIDEYLAQSNKRHKFIATMIHK